MTTRPLSAIPAIDAHPVPRPWTWALLFLLFAAALAAIQWGAIQNTNHEMGDFAANSLLIQDAKRLHLVYGNYSRVGFNHPGPAILYVLAGGELLFHDLLHLVPSPFSGQLLAASLYDAAWLLLIVALVRRMAGRLVPALLFAAVTALALAYGDHAILGGIWFPHLYVLPYAAMLLAIARLVHGHADALTPLAVASGFLINGHASFVPILGVMLVLVVAANAALSARGPAERILARAWFSRHRRAIRLACGILFLFFVPLIVATVKDFPGPIYQYVKFSRGNKGNTLAQALAFIGVYWGVGPAAAARGALAWGALLALALLASLRGPQDAFKRAARALGIVFAAATLAVLYYAKVGVDMLDQVYIALFYSAVPALTAGLLALLAWQAAAWRGRDLAAGALALAALAVCWHLVRQPTAASYAYDHPTVADLYRQASALPRNGRLVLDLDDDPKTWGDVWGNTLGLLAQARRHGVELACVDAGWHISFTARLKCTPQEAAANPHYLVRHTTAPDPLLGEPDAEALGLSLYRAGAAPRPFSYVTVREAPDYFKGILGKGWAAVEGDFVWTEGSPAEIRLPAAPGRARMLTLDMGSFIPNPYVYLHVQARANGKPAGAWVFYTSEVRRRITLDLGADAAAEQHIELHIDRPHAPSEFNLSADARRLGLSLYGIKKEAQ
ncbi:hypothetical protein HH212_02915 [Massilia forsythiae]|uniref:Uncharacterized protein n=1 Tax=Massilia forsythiae TaxID=2728020 RepID=A0A7Z2VTE7_9BURK|nr:hypothetical protein [Massilia forsythiae]QJD99115.1 hypothetical protein HH212_02915 [Massilia forsythiae]